MPNRKEVEELWEQIVIIRAELDRIRAELFELELARLPGTAVDELEKPISMPVIIHAGMVEGNGIPVEIHQIPQSQDAEVY